MGRACRDNNYCNLKNTVKCSSVFPFAANGPRPIISNGKEKSHKNSARSDSLSVLFGEMLQFHYGEVSCLQCISRCFL